MRAGALDRRITLRRFTPGAPNAFNEVVDAWNDLATLWASKRDISDGERTAAAQTGASITTRFQIRWSATVADLSPKDQLACEGKLYEITAVKELGRREGLEITARAKADAA